MIVSVLSEKMLGLKAQRRMLILKPNFSQTADSKLRTSPQPSFSKTKSNHEGQDASCWMRSLGAMRMKLYLSCWGIAYCETMS